MQNHDLILKAAKTAKECGLKVAVDLASFNIVAENLEFLRGLVRDYVDIVFANEDEAKTFTCEAEPLNALQVISEMCELAVVKIGIKGAMIKQGDEVVHVGIMPRPNAWTRRVRATSTPRDSFRDSATDFRCASAARSVPSRRARSSRSSARHSAKKRGRTSPGS